MRVSKVDFQQSEAPDWVQERQEDQKAMWFFAAANGCYSLCGKLFWSRCKNDEIAQRTCGNKTIQNIKECTGTSNRQTGEGRLNKLTECVYKVPCANCDKTYISETGRKSGVRLQEHRTELESKIGRTFTRSLRASSLTDPLSPTTQLKKRTMSSTGLKRRWSIIDSEPERFTRWIKEVIHIRKRRKEGQHAMNADEGSYQLSHAYDRFLDTASSRHVKNRKNWVPASSDESFW